MSKRKQARCSCGKVAYSSRKWAGQAAAHMRARLSEPFRAYHCVRGHAWHVGHPPGWKEEQARLRGEVA